jgi:hypothetical protein
VIPLQMMLAALLAWRDREQRDVLAFLREENRVLKAQLGRRRLWLDDEERRRLAVLGERLAAPCCANSRRSSHRTRFCDGTGSWWLGNGRTPRQRQGRPGVQKAIRRLVTRMTENPQWGYTRIQGALKNVAHRVARSTIASILRAEGLPPRGRRSTPWTTFLRAHWPALVAADFFTREVWTGRGLVTYYTIFVIELQSRRVRVGGATGYPDEAFVLQAMREPIDTVEGGRAWTDCDLRPRSEVERRGRGLPEQ